MTRRSKLHAFMAFLLLPSLSWAADDQASTSDNQATAGQAYADIRARTNGEPVLLQPAARFSQYDVRFGWWALWNNGSPAKTGEYQDLNPSPFWDFDGLSSNGTQTLGITATGNDQETTLGKLYYFQPGLTAKVDYDRFLHRLDHDPLDNMGNPRDTYFDPATKLLPKPNSADPKIIKEDINVGQDYAVRVQELKASFKTNISDNLKARLDVWGLQKEGARQVNAVGKCYANTAGNGVTNLPPDHLQTFAGNKCHVLSQMQQIDWITSELKPVIEARLGESIVIEYSRPMRNFTSADSMTSRYYDRTGILSYLSPPSGNKAPVGIFANPFPYAVAPDSYTQMDQLKISGNLGEETKAYAFLMSGNTINEEISMQRWFNNMDFRLTNSSIKNVSLTGYGKIFNETENLPNTDDLFAAAPEDANTRTGRLREPIDYHKSTGGLKGNWRPGGRGYGLGGLAIAAGYEYGDLERTNAIFTSPTVPTATNLRAEIDESRTITHSFQIGPDLRLSPCFDTFLHYKYQNAVQPLIGFKQDNGVFNTMLPQHDHIVELGFNWVPTEWFVFYACFGVERADNHSQPALVAADPTLSNVNFDEENYPMSFSIWYAASRKLSFSAGYFINSNFVGQDIVIGDDPAPYNPPSSIKPVVARWNYGGRAQVLTLGSRYAATDCVTLTGSVEWARGQDLINNSDTFYPASGAFASDVGSFTEVNNETTRLILGLDWQIRPRIVNYYRYELYNFLDKSPGYQTGTAQGVLGGLSALF
jgi:hypothetical protein